MEKANIVWEKLEESLRAEFLSSEDIKFEKCNNELIDAQRQFVNHLVRMRTVKLCIWRVRYCITSW